MEEIEKWFESLIGPGTYDMERSKRLRNIAVDGIRLAERYAELRAPGSNFLDKPFIEAREVLNMLVDLRMDGDVTNILRRDAPDIEVRFSSRGPLYVEQSSVMEEGTPFERHLEEARLFLQDMAANESGLKAFLNSGWLNIRLTDPGHDKRQKPANIAAEAARLRSEIQREVLLMSPDSIRYPTLALYRASISYKPGLLSNALVFQQDAGAFDPVPSWIAPRMLDALKKKRTDAKAFDPTLRPLWLLLSLAAGEVVPTPFLRPDVEGTLIGIDIAPFDRLVVRMSGMQPIVVDQR